MKITARTLTVLVGIASMSMILAGCMGGEDLKPEKEDPRLQQLQDSGAPPVPGGHDPGDATPPKKGAGG